MDSGFEEHPLNGQSNQKFKPNDNISAKVDDSALDKLVHTANELSNNKLEIVLRTDMLYYQYFTDMNSYTNVFSLAKTEA